MKHPLNKKQQGSKEPWSGEQKLKWEKDADEVQKKRGYQQVIPPKPKTITKRGRKGQTITRTRMTKGKKTWIAPTLSEELDPLNTILVIDIEKCSNFGLPHIR